MSDNIPAQEIRRRLVISLSTETWTDVLKLFSRQILVQQFSPVCYYLKEISNENVKSVHTITMADQFKDKLTADDPEANQQLDHLAGHNCQLANQFWLTLLSINENSRAILPMLLRHCPDLFQDCQIEMNFFEGNKDSPLPLECLSQLEESKPYMIIVSHDVDPAVDIWHHPTFLNCTRIHLHFWKQSWANVITAPANIYEWLHHHYHRPAEMMMVDCDSAAASSAVAALRCMILSDIDANHTDWLINRCSENFQNSRGEADRRSFVLSFYTWHGLDQFHRRIVNNSTGEVLVLDRVPTAPEYYYLYPTYRLRRCMVEEEANEQEMYAKIFTQDGYDRFQWKKDTKTPRVRINC